METGVWMARMIIALANFMYRILETVVHGARVMGQGRIITLGLREVLYGG